MTITDGEKESINLLEKTILIRLNRLDLGQIIEGLSIRQQEWQQTADWYAGKTPELPDHLKECSNGREAQWIADNYSRILDLIEWQFREQL